MTYHVADLIPRLQSKVAIQDDGCWWWTGAISGNGYGRVNKGPRGAGTAAAHRFVYEALVGSIGDLPLDHLCRVRRCVNPSHLEPVPQSLNLLRGVGPGVTRSRFTDPARTCPAGHKMTDENTYVHVTRAGYPNRQCRACRSEESRRRRARKHAA